MPHPLYSPVRRAWPLGRRAGARLAPVLLAPALLVGLGLPRPAGAQTLAQMPVAQGPGGPSPGSQRPAALAPVASASPGPTPASLTPPGSSLEPGGPPGLALKTVLASNDLALLNQACLQAARADQVAALQQLRLRLLAVKPAPQPLAVVLANAEALVNCRAADDALAVLNRYGPAPGRERSLWLLAQWRAADAGLHHRLAAEALLRLAEGRLASLDGLALTIQSRRDGSRISRPALDVLADHLIVLGQDQQAAAALLAGRQGGQQGAERLQRAVALLVALPLAERNQLLETALDQAAAAGAWGLAAELLRDQRALLLAAGAQAQRPSDRLLRLSRRIDDAYAEWQMGREASRHQGSGSPSSGGQAGGAAPSGRQDGQGLVRQQQLEQQLRSPRQAGGHAASLP